MIRYPCYNSHALSCSTWRPHSFHFFKSTPNPLRAKPNKLKKHRLSNAEIGPHASTKAVSFAEHAIEPRWLEIEDARVEKDFVLSHVYATRYGLTGMLWETHSEKGWSKEIERKRKWMTEMDRNNWGKNRERERMRAHVQHTHTQMEMTRTVQQINSWLCVCLVWWPFVYQWAWFSRGPWPCGNISKSLEIIIDLPLGFPIHNIISLKVIYLMILITGALTTGLNSIGVSTYFVCVCACAHARTSLCACVCVCNMMQWWISISFWTESSRGFTSLRFSILEMVEDACVYK